MQNHFTVRGVPTSLVMDGWWLNCSQITSNGDETTDEHSLTPSRAQKPWIPVLGILLLVLVADFLFWKQTVGLSLAIYSVVLFGVATHNLPLRNRVRPTVLLVIGALPVVEYVQLLSLLFLGSTLFVALVWAHAPNLQTSKYVGAATRLLLSLPLSGLRALLRSIQFHRVSTKGGATQAARRLARNWMFPIGGSLIFLSLLIEANPVFAQILSFDLDIFPSLDRIVFWLGTGLLLWPLVGEFKVDDRAFSSPTGKKNLPNMGLNAGSVLRALVMFNLLIGVQTSMDLSIFSGGTDLPNGMTYARYAHRGAYPLVITALLAGAFALSARPFLREHRLIKPLLMLWLVQNTLLCLSAGLRLELYIEAYGLTYLRIRAFIWMGMVAVGLALTAWQILKAHTNRWLVLRCASMAIGVLYICCFVNFAAMIATVNIANHKANPYDLCSFGPTAARAIQDAVAERPKHIWTTRTCDFQQHNIDGWRDWGVRKWRTQL